MQLRSPDVPGGGGGIPRQSTGVTGQVTGYFRAFLETRADLALIKPFDYRSRYTGGRQPSKRTERFINNLPRLTSGEKKKFLAPISLSDAREFSLITDSYGIISFLISSSFSFQRIRIISFLVSSFSPEMRFDPMFVSIMIIERVWWYRDGVSWEQLISNLNALLTLHNGGRGV